MNKLNKTLLFLDAVGIPWSVRTATSNSLWDGQTMAIRAYGIGFLTHRFILHDASHWLITPPERRRIPNYGLGTVVKGDGCIVPREVAQAEEARAELLGLLYEVELFQLAKFPPISIDKSYLVEAHRWLVRYGWLRGVSQRARSLLRKVLWPDTSTTSI